MKSTIMVTPKKSLYFINVNEGRLSLLILTCLIIFFVLILKLDYAVNIKLPINSVLPLHNKELNVVMLEVPFIYRKYIGLETEVIISCFLEEGDSPDSINKGQVKKIRRNEELHNTVFQVDVTIRAQNNELNCFNENITAYKFNAYISTANMSLYQILFPELLTLK